MVNSKVRRYFAQLKWSKETFTHTKTCLSEQTCVVFQVGVYRIDYIFSWKVSCD